MAWRRRRWAGGNIGVSNPFLCRQRPALLSVWDSVIRSRMLKQSAIHVWGSTLPSNSRSLYVTWPYGLPHASLIRCDSISWLFDNSISTSINYDYGFLGPWLIQDHYSRWWFVQDHYSRWWFVGDLPSSFCVLDSYVCSILNTTLESYVRRDWICSLLILVRMWLSLPDNQAVGCFKQLAARGFLVAM